MCSDVCVCVFVRMYRVVVNYLLLLYLKAKPHPSHVPSAPMSSLLPSLPLPSPPLPSPPLSSPPLPSLLPPGNTPLHLATMLGHNGQLCCHDYSLSTLQIVHSHILALCVVADALER